MGDYKFIELKKEDGLTTILFCSMRRPLFLIRRVTHVKHRHLSIYKTMPAMNPSAKLLGDFRLLDGSSISVPRFMLM